MTERATKDDVIARLDEAHVALIGAAEAMARRYGASAQVKQIYGAAAMITDDWIPAIHLEKPQEIGCLNELMIFFRAETFYPVQGVKDRDLSLQAKEHAELNPGTIRVEDAAGAALWSLH